jgi:hypothetical protein
MLDIEAQLNLAQSRLALQGMSLWTQMLRSSMGHPDHAAGTTPCGSPAEDASAQAHAAASATEPAFASYRSSGGHAVAQVVMA